MREIDQYYLQGSRFAYISGQNQAFIEKRSEDWKTIFYEKKTNDLSLI